MTGFADEPRAGRRVQQDCHRRGHKAVLADAYPRAGEAGFGGLRCGENILRVNYSFGDCYSNCYQNNIPISPGHGHNMAGNH